MGIDPIVKLTSKAAQALTNLRGSPDFGDFLKWVEEYRQKESGNCEEAEGVILHRAQGSTKALRRLIEAYAEAPETLEKLKSKSRGENR